MDPLSQVFALLNVESTLSARLEAGGAWAMRFNGYRHVKFGAVLRGSCWITVDSVGAPVLLADGDCYLLANGLPYGLAGDLETEPVDGRAVFAAATDGIARHGDSDDTVVIGAQFVFDEINAKVLLDFLPPLIHVRAASDPAHALRSALDLLATESLTPQLGSALVADRLAQIVFVQALRAYAASARRPADGWLGALADPQIGAALDLMHREPARRWTVQDLARAVGMSRSSFALRFRTLVGLAPLDYLLRWRMQTAAQALREGDRTVASIGTAWGYGSESAFSNAFKRVMGRSPSRYRNEALGRSRKESGRWLMEHPDPRA